MSAYIVFGATGGIGSELSRRLVARGERVLLGGRSTERLRHLAEQLDMPYEPVDANQLSAIGQVFDRADVEFGEIQGVVNAIGSVLLKPVHRTSDEEFEQTLQINLMTSFAILREAAQRMRKQGGSIVFLSSAAAQRGMPNHEAIAAAKAGVEGLARSAAATYAPRGIRVNVIAPGLVRTELTRSIWENEASAIASTEMHALGRLGTPEDVAACAEWLLDEAASWITGQVVGVDGGLASLLPRRKA